MKNAARPTAKITSRNPQQSQERILDAALKEFEAKGTLNPEFDSGQLLLSMMALTAYPLAFPQLSRLATGLDVSDPKFQKQRDQFLRQFAVAFKTRTR